MSLPLKDPFYNQLLTALSGHLDPAVFERCMGDLLRQDFLGLVPVPGGGDSGFDGLIPDDTEGAFPLICTTAEDVERNLRRSLEAIRKRDWPARKVALATSQALTPQRRLALVEKATAKGFRMVQVFDRDALADRLYSNSRWCQELLRLSWAPSPLSAVPATRRPLMTLEPIGREDALSWIRSAAWDCLIAGQPGSGKTFLLYYLIRGGWPGLFLASSGFEEEKIILALNEQRPEWIVVDDAHASDHLEKLLHLRRRLGADFKVLATTWKGSRDEILHILGATTRQSFELELLTRNEIVEVFRGMGVQAEDEILRLMVNQAANKPGLAVTLGSLWLKGEWREVLDGTALLREMLVFFNNILTQDARWVLSAFSLGGDSGMEQAKVQEFLGLPRDTIWQVVTQLAVGGVLSENPRTRAFVVWPRELRYALLRKAFSPESAARHDLLNLLEQVPDPLSAVETIVAAQVPLSSGKLRELVWHAGTTEAWEMLAQFSEADAQWVLENFPRNRLSIASATLLRAPGPTIRFLLEQAVSARTPTHSPPEHPMQILEDWISDLDPPVLERVSRRKLVAKIGERFLKNGGNRTVGLHGILLALKPGLESHSPDPGLGNRITIYSNTVSLQEIAEIRGIWEAHRGAIEFLEAADWPIVSGILWGWVYPDYAARSAHLPRRVESAMRSFARRLLRDLAPLAKTSPALSASFLDLAEEAGVQLKLKRAPVFELLYPTPDSHPESPQGEDLTSFLRETARIWENDGARKSAERLAVFEREVRETGRPCWPRKAPDLCRVLAGQISHPEEWLNAFLGSDLPDDLVQPFLERVVEEQRNGWEEILSRLLEENRHSAFLLGLIGKKRLPAVLMDEILKKASGFPHRIEALCQKGIVPLPTLKALLNHPDQETALAAAVGEWLADPRGEVRPELRDDWRAVLLKAGAEEDTRRRRAATSSYWLEEILRLDKDLAFEWAKIRLREKERPYLFREKSLLANVLSTLDDEQRVVLLGELRQGIIPSGLVGFLIAGDPQLYRSALAIEELGRHHLEPLEEIPDAHWANLASAALDAGFDADQIALASLRGIRSFWGSGRSTFERLDQAFAQLENDPREEIREIARRGRDNAQRRIQRAEEEEHRDARHGL